MNEMKEEGENIGDKPEVILVDLGNVLLYSKEKLPGKMNPRHKQLLEEFGEDYPFFNYFGVNEKLLELLASLKDKYRIYIITEGTIQNYPPLKEKLETVFDFDNIISTGELGLDKTTPEAYEHVVEQLGIDPGKILFVDDSPDNTSAASTVGLQVIQCISEDQIISELKGRLDLK